MKPSEFMFALRDKVLNSEMTRLELAAKIGVDYQRLGYFVRLPTARPDIELVDRLAEYFGYSICNNTAP